MDACPICKGPRKDAKHNPSYPFCCARCKLADLSNWMDGNYKLDAEPASLDDEAGLGGDKPTLH